MRYQQVCIESTGYCLPEQVLTSQEIELQLAPLWEKLHYQHGYLESLTGIKERRIWPIGTPPSKVASKAAQAAMDQGRIVAGEVDLIIHTGVCRDASEPSTANIVHHLLGLSPHCIPFDVSNACLGFLNGLTIAANMIELGQIKTALVVSGENSAPIYQDTVEILLKNPSETALRKHLANLTLGSGAVAFVLQHKDVSQRQHSFLGGIAQTDNKSHHLCKGHGDLYHQSMETDTLQLMKKGLIISQVTWELFKNHLGWRDETPDHIFNHQVSRSHQAKVFSMLGLDAKEAYSDMENLGNTGTVATPLSLVLRQNEGKIKSGDKIAMLGIGSGLNCMMLGVQW